MQGTAAAYDLANFADATSIKLGDVSLAQAEKSAARVNHLLGTSLCHGVQVEALKKPSLCAFLEGVDVLLSCVPYWMHPQIEAIAVEQKVNVLELGGNTEVTMMTLALDDAAKANGVTIIPDTGLAPGLVNSLGLYLIEQLDKAEAVKMYCGVLPQHPKPPFNYKLTFNVEGLVTEYDYQAVALRHNEIVMIDTLSELEELYIEELGKMEAFVTSGGTSTAPYTLKGRVENYEYKTIRFPGHCERIAIFRDFGFWNEEEVDVKGVRVKPREVFYKVFGDALSKFEDLDQCAVRGVGIGVKNGERVQLQVDIFDRQCEKTGFTSMERLTGFSMAIYAAAVARGEVPTGAVRYENALTGVKFVEEIQKRGIGVKFSEKKLA